MNGDLGTTAAPRWEKRLIIAICLVAGLRIWLFAAGYPFFSNADEEAHLDMVIKFSRGYWPKQTVEPFDHESMLNFALLGSLEIMRTPRFFPGGQYPPPPWRVDEPTAQEMVKQRYAYWAKKINHEANSPPVYYMMAGIWHRVLAWTGVLQSGGIYWVRFLNVPLYVGFVWLTYVYCRRIAPDEAHVYLGVPAMLAVLPQDVFYQVNSDVPAALGFMAGMILLHRWHMRGGLRLAVIVALVVAATFLVKLSNIALPIVFGAVMLCHLRQRPRAVGWALAAAAAPVALWVVRNVMLFGDVTGTAAKAEQIGFVVRPVAQYLKHPIFTPTGCWTYLSGLFATLWRGEWVWNGRQQAFAWLDMLYVASTLVLLIAALVASLRRGPKLMDMTLHALVWLSVLWIAFLSVYHDYPTAFFPSMDHPYHTTGRLICGCLGPLMILYVRGAATLGGRIGAWAVVGVMCAVMLISEVILTRPVFASPFNWFHLP